MLTNSTSLVHFLALWHIKKLRKKKSLQLLIEIVKRKVPKSVVPVSCSRYTTGKLRSSIVPNRVSCPLKARTCTRNVAPALYLNRSGQQAGTHLSEKTKREKFAFAPGLGQRNQCAAAPWKSS